jgi:hypothetical protein
MGGDDRMEQGTETHDEVEAVEADSITDPQGKEIVKPQEPMGEADLRQLAIDVMAGNVYGSWMMNEHELPDILGMVFMPLILGAKLPPNAAHVYEYMNQAGPRAINGMPTFMSCRVLIEEDSKKLKPLLEELVAQQEAFKTAGS